MKYLKYILLLLFSYESTGQTAFQGGSGSGSVSLTFSGGDTCIHFYGGDAGSSMASALFNSPFNCGMFFGDSLSGTNSNSLNSTLNCIFYKGNQGSGYGDDFYDNPATCPAFYASASGNDGYHARSYSEDAGICFVVALPIQASPLFARTENNQGYLYWSTYVEENNYGFEIHKSYDAVNWNVIGWVEGEGDYIGEIKYDFIDRELQYRNQYYRFAQIDYDGSVSLSNTVNLHPSATSSGPNHIAIYPNPVRIGQQINIRSWISYELEVEILLTNTLGQLIERRQYTFNEFNNLTSLTTQNLVTGNYFLIIRDNDGILGKQKIIITP
jgi:hypothetical protein